MTWMMRRRRRSLEQEIPELVQAHVAERRSVVEQIEAGWSRQVRRPTAAEIDAWIGVVSVNAVIAGESSPDTDGGLRYVVRGAGYS